MRRCRARLWPLALTLVLVSGLTGCEAKSEGSDVEDEPSAEESTTGDRSAAGAVELAAAGNRFEYDRTEIEAAPDEQLRVTFTNTADEDSLKHNVVQLSTDKARTAMEVAKAGWKVPDQGYVPDHDAVLAATPLAESGETVDVSFTTPSSPGEYLYICTFPAHYPSMQGRLVVREP